MQDVSYPHQRPAGSPSHTSLCTELYSGCNCMCFKVYFNNVQLYYSEGDGNTIKASFKVFIDTSVRDLTTKKVGTYFNSQLPERNNEKILEPKYVLATKDGPSAFKPDPAASSSK